MDAATLVSFVVWIIVVGSIFGLLWWLVGYVGLPEPFNKFARVAIAVIAVLMLINLLLGLVGKAPFRLSH
jgi:predicted tellurium resistance membrane protein TerC